MNRESAEVELKFPRLTCVAIIVAFTPFTAFAVFAAIQPDIVARLVGGFFVMRRVRRVTSSK